MTWGKPPPERVRESEEHEGFPNRETWAFRHAVNEEDVRAIGIDAAYDVLTADYDVDNVDLGSRVIEAYGAAVEDALNSATEPEHWARAMVREVGSFWRVDEGVIGQFFRDTLVRHGLL